MRLRVVVYSYLELVVHITRIALVTIISEDFSDHVDRDVFTCSVKSTWTLGEAKFVLSS